MCRIHGSAKGAVSYVHLARYASKYLCVNPGARSCAGRTLRARLPEKCVEKEQDGPAPDSPAASIPPPRNDNNAASYKRA